MAESHRKSEKEGGKPKPQSGTVFEDGEVRKQTHHCLQRALVEDTKMPPSTPKSDYATAKRRIEGQLEMLRRDLTIMQSQDQSLLRQLLHIHEMIGQLSGQRFRRSSVATSLGGGPVEVEIQEIIQRLSPRRLRSLSLSHTDQEDVPEFAFDESFDQLSCSYPSAF